MDEIHSQIDAIIRLRHEAVYNFSMSTQKMLALGVKIGYASTGEINVPESFAPYLDKYDISELEFEWEVRYQDGSILRQYEGQEQHNFEDIDQSRIKSVAFVSNFDYPIDNPERRVIARLNWETGVFEFTNGFIPQEDKGGLVGSPVPGVKKLILKTSRRHTASAGRVSDALPEMQVVADEVYYFNRFILGYEVSGGGDKIIIIDPLGNIRRYKK